MEGQMGSERARSPKDADSALFGSPRSREAFSLFREGWCPQDNSLSHRLPMGLDTQIR